MNNLIDDYIAMNQAGLVLELCKKYYDESVTMINNGQIFAESMRESYDKQKSFINVRKVMTVDEVDLDSGNIEFNGDLFVRGDIVDNMAVTLEGDLFVKGNIGASNIFAKGNIKCEGGVVTKNKGKVICKGDFFAKFIENSIVNCYGDIHVANAILNR